MNILLPTLGLLTLMLAYASCDNLPQRIRALPIAVSQSTQRSRGSFFKDIMGIAEDSVIDTWHTGNMQAYNKLMRPFLSMRMYNGQPVYMLTNASGKEFQAGFFHELSLGELRKKYKPRTKRGTFSLVIGQNTTDSAPYKRNVDVTALQVDPKNRDAVFQVASNFSALEPINSQDYPEDGVTKYIYDKTQGPYAAIAAAPGLIYRMYYMFYNSKTEPGEWRQTRQRQINLLDQVPQFPVTNGYVDFSGDQKFWLYQPIPEDDIAKIKIGFHRDIQVTYGLATGANHPVITDQKQIVNQVFTAGLDLGGINWALRNNVHALDRARILLDAAYEGTIRSAAVMGKRKLYLTLIGGGVFANNIIAIAQAIAKHKDIIINSGLDVILCIYNLQDLYNNYGEKTVNLFLEQLRVLVDDTEGAYTHYK